MLHLCLGKLYKQNCYKPGKLCVYTQSILCRQTGGGSCVASIYIHGEREHALIYIDNDKSFYLILTLHVPLHFGVFNVISL